MGFHNFITNFIVSSNVNTVMDLFVTPTVPLNIYIPSNCPGNMPIISNGDVRS